MSERIKLEEIVIDSDVKSEKKKKFLEFCKKRIHEAIDIYTKEYPQFDVELHTDKKSPHKLIIYSSRRYDAEIETETWCYIDFVANNEEGMYRVDTLRADREGFIFKYRGQEFLIHYGSEIPKSSKI